VFRENEHIWRTGEPWSSDFRILAKDGRVLWFHLEGRAVAFGEDRLPTVYQGIITDIHDRKVRELAMEATIARQRALLEGMPAMPWTEEIETDGNSRITYLGPQSRELLGWSVDELQRDAYEHMARFVHPQDRARVANGYQLALATGGEWDETYRVVTKDGTVRWIRSTGRRSPADGAGTQVWHGVTHLLKPGEEPTAGAEAAAATPEV